MAALDQQMRNVYLACARALVASETNLDHIDDRGIDINLPVFSVGQVAQLADIHPQTLRQYDRLGLIVPDRTEGGARRYSLRDIDRLYQAQHLSQDESINIAGVSRILDLAEENRQLRRQIRRMRKPEGSNIFEARVNGEVVEVERTGHSQVWHRQTSVYVEELSHHSKSDTHSMSKSLVVWGLH
ncbi:heat shock protein transcriptional repressor HspR [Bombiscardovia coagulans]|uniref:Heat shock regulatory protein hspR n=1 Tax=Bombiscardovia coagulans TaxID=686666 RepID=A0A261EU87_9BIFI|nr:helix-turn-helix transcriptional regulator [Bombiscardovia coagulans]OZG50431.1 heat shock regulatory protein hspR [Bombiscardovia coagulans]